MAVNFYSISQNEQENDSLIYLDEIIIYNNDKNCNKLLTKGKKNSTFSVSTKSEIVSLISNIPNGRINSVKFFFNNRKNIIYEQNFFRLKMYDVENNLPNKVIISKELRFTVSEKKEYIILDLNPLEISNKKQLFIGIELLNESKNHSFSIDCNSNKNNSSTFYKLSDSNNWFEIPDIDIRMELNVGCDK